ncbi:hypothetical protein M758_4G166700 [Ceratodon purpureus]|nr:hypothetical protein M758_4G166700 [Ceratodon purpureus]
MANLEKGKGKGGGRSGSTRKVPETTVSRLQRVFKKIGLDEAYPGLHQASESELQVAFARYLHKAERHTELGISEDFNPVTLPTITFSAVDNSVHPSNRPMAVVENRSPLMKPYFDTLTMAELMSLMSNKMSVAFDEPPLDEEDFLGCRYFFRFVAEAVEHGSRVIVMQDEKQTVAVMVHVKAIHKLKGDPGTALFRVEYNCVPKTDPYLMERMTIISEFMKNTTVSTIVGTEHQIHFINQVLQAHERILDKSVGSKHDEEWYPRQKFIRPSFIVPLSPMTSDAELSTLQELEGAPASERTRNEPDPHCCVVCDQKSTKLKICSVCKSVKYCSRDCQVSDWPSHKKRCKAAESKPSPSGASILLNPKGMDMGDNIMTLINHRDPIGSITNIKPAKVNHMPDHKEGELYVIKVQAGSRDCLIYDRQRSFTTMVSDPREQAALRPVITSVNHRGGAKAYMYAKNEGNQFRVYLEDLPEQYVNW